ncbi:Flp family type IVb pilin [Palleronia sp. THAF1]|uniref:Flp family type IVb pilin n=1 Tax=Palleronia sp. THAF1 TaxID=2587842 RepID=UPI000F543BE0|nr:hypothetical protein [Palleronia sp. THAF1]
MARLKRFLADTSGAVTVDWVVITAAICGLAFAVLTLIWGESEGVSAEVSGFLSTMSVSTDF